MSRKHQPQRTCFVCRQAQDKRQLLRLVRTPQGQVVFDPGGKINGRGAYLCHRPACLNKGLQPKRLAHALKTTVSPEMVRALQTALPTEAQT